MSSYSPEPTHVPLARVARPFKLALLEQSLALSESYAVPCQRRSKASRAPRPMSTSPVNLVMTWRTRAPTPLRPTPLPPCPTPTADATHQTRMPAATPSADIVDAGGPAASALRTIRAVSGPGVAMSNAESATQATNLPSTSNYAPLRLRSRVGSGEELDDLGVVLRGIDVVKAVERGHGVDQLGPLIEHLAGTGVAFERHELVPKLARQHHRRRPFAGLAARDGARRPPPPAAPGAPQR